MYLMTFAESELYFKVGFHIPGVSSAVFGAKKMQIYTKRNFYLIFVLHITVLFKSMLNFKYIR